MSLHFRMCVGLHQVAFVEIQRTSGGGPQPPPNSVGTYQVRVDDEVVGRVRHRYGDGMWTLARKALALIEQRKPREE